MEREPRKIVLILGNGFDLDLGLKTSYKDFWNSEFCPKDYPAPLINHLNQRWPDNLEGVKWYDLENELLNYYKSIPDPKNPGDFLTEEEREFMVAFEPYQLSYGMYRDKQEIVHSLIRKRVIVENNHFLFPYIAPYKEDVAESPKCRDRKALQLIKNGLCKYLQSICRQEAVNYKSVAMNVLFAANCAQEAGNTLSIYTFNYTPPPEDYGNTIHYVHGKYSTENIIIGTRDDGVFDIHYDFLQKAFDPNFNPPAIVPALFDADEVIIFGHSIGENDRQYFKPFFNQQAGPACRKRKDITIFTWDDSSVVEIKRSLQKMTDYNLSTLFSQNNVEIIKTSRIQDASGKLQKFIMTHISDTDQARVTLNQLLEEM